MKKIIQSLSISLILISLTACSSFFSSSGSGGGDNAGATASGSQSMGVGSLAGFKGLSNLTPAERNLLTKRVFYFSFDSANVDQTDIPAIEAHARYLVAHPSARVLLEGNTDARGSREYNIALGERRARDIAEILRVNGVHSNQIKTISYGEERPVALGHSDAAYKLNRRVELVYEAH